VLAAGGGVAQESFATWLRRRGETLQDEVLGPVRARLFREGKLTLTELLDAASGRALTLEELGA
jgi:hypothetical protein